LQKESLVRRGVLRAKRFAGRNSNNTQRNGPGSFKIHKRVSNRKREEGGNETRGNGGGEKSEIEMQVLPIPGEGWRKRK